MIQEQITRYTFYIEEPLRYPICADDGMTYGIINRVIDVELRNHVENLWVVVVDCSGVLSNDGYVEFEGLPSGRTEDFLRRTRFSLEEALDRARKFIEQGKPQ